MISEDQIIEIRNVLESCSNPLFLFDNDVDGFCSFLLLSRAFLKGKGVAVKTFPDLDESYFRKIKEFNSDCVFILDKPKVSKDFFERVFEVNIPVYWIDHHLVENFSKPSFVNYFNSYKEPVTAICYEIVKFRSLNDFWINLLGCIGDRFLPLGYDKFLEYYPDLGVFGSDAFKIYYESTIGKIAMALNFSLKDKVSNVMRVIKFMNSVQTPYEVVEEMNKQNGIFKRYDEIKKKYDKLFSLACEKVKNSKLIFFCYGGSLSISSDLANELSYKFPEKFVVVGYKTSNKVNISARGKNAKNIILSAISNLENSTGGGHEEAVGAKILSKDLDIFKKKILENLRD